MKKVILFVNVLFMFLISSSQVHALFGLGLYPKHFKFESDKKEHDYDRVPNGDPDQGSSRRPDQSHEDTFDDYSKYLNRKYDQAIEKVLTTLKMDKEELELAGRRMCVRDFNQGRVRKYLHREIEELSETAFFTYPDMMIGSNRTFIANMTKDEILRFGKFYVWAEAIKLVAYLKYIKLLISSFDGPKDEGMKKDYQKLLNTVQLTILVKGKIAEERDKEVLKDLFYND